MHTCFGLELLIYLFASQPQIVVVCIYNRLIKFHFPCLKFSATMLKVFYKQHSALQEQICKNDKIIIVVVNQQEQF